MRRNRSVLELRVAADILGAVEGWHLAVRTCARSSAIAGIRMPTPPGRMPRLSGSQDGCRYNVGNNLGTHGSHPRSPRSDWPFERWPALIPRCYSCEQSWPSWYCPARLPDCFRHGSLRVIAGAGWDSASGPRLLPPGSSSSFGVFAISIRPAKERLRRGILQNAWSSSDSTDSLEIRCTLAS